MKKNIIRRIEMWEQEKKDILDNKYRNVLINNSADAMICDVVAQELRDLLSEIEEITNNSQQTKTLEESENPNSSVCLGQCGDNNAADIELSETQEKMQGCGKVWADESDEYYSEDAMRHVAPKRKCGETFDEGGIDYCNECASNQENTRGDTQ